MSDTPIPFPGSGTKPPRRFDTGQLVRLKSGGPVMTVSDLATLPRIVIVDWFTWDNYANRTQYHEDQLVEVDPGAAS